jgi:hypothetical protein
MSAYLVALSMTGGVSVAMVEFTADSGVMARRWGPATTARVGVAVCATGYLLLWLSTAAIITPNVGFMIFSSFVAFSG